MDSEIEVIAKKYKLDSNKSIGHKSFEVFPNYYRAYQEKIKLLEKENERIRRKYLEAVEKNKGMSKELDALRAKVGEGKKEEERKLLGENERVIQVYREQIEFLIEDAGRSEEIFANEVKALKMKLGIARSSGDFQGIIHMKSKISRQKREIEKFIQESNAYKRKIEEMQKDFQKEQEKCIEEAERFSKTIKILQDNLDVEKMQNHAYLEETLMLKAKISNMQFDIDLRKSRSVQNLSRFLT